MMERFNFHPKWRHWIRECLSTASASVLVNGSPSGEFCLERGLRQGDPLSPFLFLIAAEGLSILLDKASERGLFEAAFIGRDRVHISHLQYADNTILMGAASEENAWVMRRTLRIMKLLSGLKINLDKCSVMGINIDEGRIQAIAEILGCRVGSLPFSYLGIRVSSNHRRLSEWSFIIQKVKNRLRKWDDKKISLGGRIRLLNSVLSSIPIYYLSIYLIPKKIMREITSIQSIFFVGGGWGGVGEL
ncbi:hypothetical protein ACS0TY_021211 [Phlomoides rotata]